MHGSAEHKNVNNKYNKNLKKNRYFGEFSEKFMNIKGKGQCGLFFESQNQKVLEIYQTKSNRYPEYINLLGITINNFEWSTYLNQTEKKNENTGK